MINVQKLQVLNMQEMKRSKSLQVGLNDDEFANFQNEKTRIQDFYDAKGGAVQISDAMTARHLMFRTAAYDACLADLVPRRIVGEVGEMLRELKHPIEEIVVTLQGLEKAIGRAHAHRVKVSETGGPTPVAGLDD